MGGKIAACQPECADQQIGLGLGYAFGGFVEFDIDRFVGARRYLARGAEGALARFGQGLALVDQGLKHVECAGAIGILNLDGDGGGARRARCAGGHPGQ